MRRYKTSCVICDRETRARRTTAKAYDVCYKCHIDAIRNNKKEKSQKEKQEDDKFINRFSRQLNFN